MDTNLNWTAPMWAKSGKNDLNQTKPDQTDLDQTREANETELNRPKANWFELS